MSDFAKLIADAAAKVNGNKAQQSAPQSASPKPQSFTDMKNSLGNLAPRQQITGTDKPTGLDPTSKGEGDAGVLPPASASPPVSGEITDKEFNSPDQVAGFDPEIVRQLQEKLEVLRNSLDNKELVTDAVRFVLQHMQTHAFLKDILKPEDYGLMVAGLRESYGSVIAKKTERKTSRAKNAELVDDISASLGDLTF